jgi:hypothetical protein
LVSRCISIAFSAGHLATAPRLDWSPCISRQWSISSEVNRLIGHGNQEWKPRLREVCLHLSLHRDLADTCCEF